MEMIPSTNVTTLKDLEAGDLFILFDGSRPSLALKTAASANGDQSELVLLGPIFPDGVSDALIVRWHAATVVSFGKTYSVILPTDPAAWFLDGPKRDAVCLAVSGDRVYICANGADRSRIFFPCFVELNTGVVVERQLPASAAYTGTWELTYLADKSQPHSILKFP